MLRLKVSKIHFYGVLGATTSFGKIGLKLDELKSANGGLTKLLGCGKFPKILLGEILSVEVTNHLVSKENFARRIIKPDENFAFFLP